MKKLINFFRQELTRIVLGSSLFAAAIITEYFINETVSLALYLLAMIVTGLAVFFDAVRGIIRLDFLDEKFLMSIASVGAMIVGEWSEGVAVMLFFLVGEFFEHKAVEKSRRSIRSLMDICPDTANVIKDGAETEMDAEDVPVGSRIVVRAGERVPLDSVVVEGCSDVDTSALTGESEPRSVSVGDEIKSGIILINGVLVAQTLRPLNESAASRILELVENANEAKSREENFITRFSRVYTPIVVALAVLIAVITPLFSLLEWYEAVYKSLIFLVISCPCALVISVPMAFFGGIGSAASRGILFKGGNVFSPLSKLETIAFDKTGTITTAEIYISRIDSDGMEEKSLLELAASAEFVSNHPVSLAIKASAENILRPSSSEELPGRGVKAIVGERAVLVGNAKLMAEFGVEYPKSDSACVYVAVDGKYSGSIFVSDKIKSGANEAIAALRKLGAKNIVILSGDKEKNVREVGENVGIDKLYSELLPDEKYLLLTELIEKSTGSCIYVGDGINDAPSIARADVGVAMGDLGADSSISMADVVLMSGELDRLPRAVKIARKTIRIANQNIILALGVKLAVMLLGVLGIANMWLAVFADVGVAVLAILNSMRTLKEGRR